ncbi:MAG TPA: DUF6049 family protein [Cellulomonadaceae bacterium]|nr:DUF6049 family protein [Cellulomonadaceae bacterium]
MTGWPRARQRRPAATIARAVGAIALMTGLLSGGSAVAQGGTGASLPGAVVQDATAVSVTITAVTPQILRPGDDLTVTATATNTSTQTIQQPRAAVLLSRTSLSTRYSLDAWASADPTSSAGTSLKSVAIPGQLDPGASTTVQITVPAAALRLSAQTSQWGARGLAVQVLDSWSRVGIARTFALWLPADQPARTSVSVLVPLTRDAADLTAEASAATPAPSQPTATGTADAGSTAAGTGSPDGSSGEPSTTGSTTPGSAGTPTVGTSGAAGAADTATFAPTGRLASVVALSAHRSGVSWAVDPALVDAARAAGSAGSTWLAALDNGAVQRDVFALPYADPDLAALAHAGASTLAQQADTLTSGLPWVNDVGALTGLQLSPDGSTDAATVDLAAQLGASAVVVDPSALAPTDLTYTPSSRATVHTPSGSVAALVPDATLSDLLRATEGTSPATAAQRILAETAVITRERPGEERHLLATVGRDWTPVAAVATAQLDALASAPWVTMEPLSKLISTAGPGVERASLPARVADPSELQAPDVATIASAQRATVTFASIVHNPAALLDGVQESVLDPLSVGWRSDTAGRATAMATLLANLSARRTGLSIIKGSNVTLISQSSEVPISLRNTLDQDATVTLRLKPRNSCLVVPQAPTVTVPAHQTVSFRVPFDAVASCNVVVDVSLLTTDGTPVADSTQFTVRVHADWENVGMAVAAGLLVLGLVVGLWRTVRRGQTARRARMRANQQAGT